MLVTIVVGSGIAAQRLSADVGLQLLANALATAFGLGVLIVLLAPVSGGHFNPVVSAAVGAYIGAGYWFTSSTAFANPAVTIGRIFTETFAGIAPPSAIPFIAAQLIGAALAVALTRILLPRDGYGSRQACSVSSVTSSVVNSCTGSSSRNEEFPPAVGTSP